MPYRLDVVCNPVFDRLVDALVHLAGVVRLGHGVPGTHVDADRKAVGVALLGGVDVDVPRRRGCCDMSSPRYASMQRATSHNSSG